MIVLINTSLSPEHRAQIQAVSDRLELVCPAGRDALLAAAGYPPKVGEAEVIFGGFDRTLFQAAPRLRWVQVLSAGVDGLLFPELVESPVTLISAKGAVGTHLADHAMGLLLALIRGLHTAVRERSWGAQGAIRAASWELEDRTIGIVGLGGTGREFAHRAAAFGARLIAVDPEPVPKPECVAELWRLDRFGELLEQSDVVVVCAPLTPETEGMFDRAAFQRMRRHALLINVTRGRVVDGEALMEALTTGQIGGAGLDVLPWEPLPENHPLWSMENVIVTPHCAGGSPLRISRSVDLFCENLRRDLAGEALLSVIDKQKGY
jgi:phosphoglycerate dehydrogenase-like enzyme